MRSRIIARRQQGSIDEAFKHTTSRRRLLGGGGQHHKPELATAFAVEGAGGDAAAIALGQRQEVAGAADHAALDQQLRELRHLGQIGHVERRRRCCRPGQLTRRALDVVGNARGRLIGLDQKGVAG